MADRDRPRDDRPRGDHRRQGGKGSPRGTGPRREGGPAGPRPGGQRPYSSKGSYPRGNDRRTGPAGPSDRQRGDRPRYDDRPRSDDRPRYDDRQRGDRPRYDDRPRRDDRPVPDGGRSDDRPRRDDRPWSDRPRRPYPPRPYGARPQPYVRPHRPPAPVPQPDGLVGGEDELIAGRRPVEEAFAARREAIRLLIVPERRAALDALAIHATTLRIPVVEVEGGTLTSLAGFDGHQGVALVARPRPSADPDQVLARARERGEAPFVLVLDSLEDPQNFGTLLRSAEAVGAHGVIYPTRRAAPLSPSAIKASAGATEHLVLAAVDDLAGTLADLHGKGLRIVGADEDASLDYSEADLRGPVAIVVGSEGRGISGTVRKRLDMTVRIPMRGKIASLNAAVAGSILLFAVAAQRPAPSAPARAAPGEQETPAETEAAAKPAHRSRKKPEPEVAAAIEPEIPAKPARRSRKKDEPAKEPSEKELLPGD